MINNCKHLDRRTKMVVTKYGVLYGYEYKCKLKSEKHVSAKKICCRNCPLQYNLFSNEMDNKRLNR